MIGRRQELDALEALYRRPGFQFMVIYGRRRVGKTTILQEFSRRHKSIFFPAQEKNDALNLRDISQSLQEFFSGDYLAPFSGWERVFSYLGKQADGADKTVLIIDEFPFLAQQNPSIKSILQHTIDHDWQQKNIFLILCGSSVSFMVNDVMGYKSPLYGRITGQLEVRPFDYLESAGFFPAYSNEEKLLAYGILGGIPRYLQAFDGQRSVQENIAREILRESTFLNDEPQMLLRMELREPSIYNSILEAIANGANKIMLIADRIHEDKSKCSKYLQVLQSMRLVRKQVPCGDSPASKKGIYILTDFYYMFWYRYAFSRKNYYALLGTEQAAAEIMAEINDYMGPIFEQICYEYLWRKAKSGRLPFVPAQMGKWWGTNSLLKAQDDVDILGLSKDGSEGIFCECKYRNRPLSMEEYEDLLTAAKAFPDISKQYFYLFSKGGYTQPVIERAKREGSVLLGIDDLYR